MLMWAVGNGCPWDKRACYDAAVRGVDVWWESQEMYEEVFDWIKAQHEQ
jgi:hypothetical protein